MNKSMKSIIMGSVLVAAATTSLSANAALATFCSGGNAGSGSTASVATDGTTFVVVAFTPKCSANVFLLGNDTSSTLYKVGAASSKGKFSYGGSTVGGAVSSTTGAVCVGTNGACSATDAGNALTAAPDS